jgi:hypothetical protein
MAGLARLASAAILWLAALACTPANPQPPPERPSGVSISNGTTLTVVVLVNGVPIDTVEPGRTADPIAQPMPQLPWHVEARTQSSGRLLPSFDVKQGDVFHTTGPDGQGSARGVGERRDLSCGRLDVWSGPPMMGPPPGPGERGDCEP